MDAWPDEPFTRFDLAQLGRTESDLRRGRRSGDVRQVVRGVFVSTHREHSIDLRVAALAKVVPAHHVVTDRTAAWLHGVDAHTYGEHDGVPPIECCALRGHEPTTLPGADGRTRDLRLSDVMLLDGVRVTTPLRTALDLGCCLRRREAFAAMCALARGHHFTRDDLARALPRYRRRRGVIQLRGLVPLVDARFESQREAWCFLAIADAGLALPEPQVWVEIDGVPTYRLDLAYARRRVCVEYDGHEAHSSDEQRAHDEARRSWLRDHGWIVIIVREGGFTGEALDQWLGELRAALDPTYSNRRW
jgi:hypothetical protein